jgi:putative ABC transport system permease protein
MNLGFDLVYAWRLLKQSWGYTLLCATVVALSVGLAIWTWSSVTYPQLLRPVGLPGAEDWYTVQIATEAATNPQPGSVDAYTYQELLKNNRTSDHVGAFAWSSGVLSEGQASANLRGGSISPRLLAQVVPFMGRMFVDTDALPGAAKVVLLSYDTWQNYLAGDRAIIGKTVRIDAAPWQVVGVMPKGFFAFEDFEMWRPLQLSKLVRPRDSKVSLYPFIKLRENQRLEAVQNETKATVDRVSREFPEFYNATRYPVVIPAHRTLTYSSTAIVIMFTFISAAVFLLGGLNISLVFLARLLERTRELALRTAIGASRSRLLRQCLQETVLVVLLGLVVGYVLAILGDQWTQDWVSHIHKILAIGRLGAAPALRAVDVIYAVMAATIIWLLSTLRGSSSRTLPWCWQAVAKAWPCAAARAPESWSDFRWCFPPWCWSSAGPWLCRSTKRRASRAASMARRSQ